MGSKRRGTAARVAGNTQLAGVTLVRANFRGYFENALSTRKIILAGRLQCRAITAAHRSNFDPQVQTVSCSGGCRPKSAADLLRSRDIPYIFCTGHETAEGDRRHSQPRSFISPST
jgi:hypothetical protein